MEPMSAIVGVSVHGTTHRVHQYDAESLARDRAGITKSNGGYAQPITFETELPVVIQYARFAVNKRGAQQMGPRSKKAVSSIDGIFAGHELPEGFPGKPWRRVHFDPRDVKRSIQFETTAGNKLSSAAEVVVHEGQIFARDVSFLREKPKR